MFINKKSINDKDSESILMVVLSYRSLTDENKKNLLDLLYQKAPCISFKNIGLSNFIRFDRFYYFFCKSSDEQKREITKLLNGSVTNREIFLSLRHLDSKTLRNLINCGFETQKIIDFFKEYTSNGAIFCLRFQFFFPVPSNEDTQVYCDFYNSEFVQLTLPEIFNRKSLSLLFATGESEATFEGFKFKRTGGCFEKDFSSVRASCLTTKALKDFVERTLSSESFSEEEIDGVRNTVSNLMEASSKEDNRIFRLLTSRTIGTAHAEGLLLFEDLFLMVNRGDGTSKSKNPGIRIFRFSSRKNEDMDYLLDIANRSRDLFPTITSGSELDQKIDAMVGHEPLAVVEMKWQSHGNCSLATSKAFVLASYYVAIRKILSKQMPCLTDTDLHDKSAVLARKIYKEFTKLYRLESAKLYLEWHKQKKTDYKYIDEKILVKIIGRFVDEASIKTIIEDSHFLEQLPKNMLIRAREIATSKKNFASIQYITSRLQSLDAALAEKQAKLLRPSINPLTDKREDSPRKPRPSDMAPAQKKAVREQAVYFLETTEKILKMIRSQEDLCTMKEDRLRIFKELIGPLDTILQRALLVKIDNIFEASTQEIRQRGMLHQFDGRMLQGDYPRPSESPRENMGPSPSMGP